MEKAVLKATPQWIARASKTKNARKIIVQALEEHPEKTIGILEACVEENRLQDRTMEIIKQTRTGKLFTEYTEQLEETLRQAGLPETSAGKLAVTALKHAGNPEKLRDNPPSQIKEALSTLAQTIGPREATRKLEQAYREKGPEAPQEINQETTRLLQEKIVETARKLGVNPPPLEDKTTSQLLETLETLRTAQTLNQPPQETIQALEKLEEYPQPVKQEITKTRHYSKNT